MYRTTGVLLIIVRIEVKVKPAGVQQMLRHGFICFYGTRYFAYESLSPVPCRAVSIKEARLSGHHTKFSLYPMAYLYIRKLTMI